MSSGVFIDVVDSTALADAIVESEQENVAPIEQSGGEDEESSDSEEDEEEEEEEEEDEEEEDEEDEA